jgi:hypothetical protein
MYFTLSDLFVMINICEVKEFVYISGKFYLSLKEEHISRMCDIPMYPEG